MLLGKHKFLYQISRDLGLLKPNYLFIPYESQNRMPNYILIKTEFFVNKNSIKKPLKIASPNGHIIYNRKHSHQEALCCLNTIIWEMKTMNPNSILREMGYKKHREGNIAIPNQVSQMSFTFKLRSWKGIYITL